MKQTKCKGKPSKKRTEPMSFITNWQRKRVPLVYGGKMDDRPYASAGAKQGKQGGSGGDEGDGGGEGDEDEEFGEDEERRGGDEDDRDEL